MFDLDDLPPARPLPPHVRALSRRRLHDAIRPRVAAPRARWAAVVGTAAAVLAVPVLGVALTGGPGTPEPGPAAPATGANPSAPAPDQLFAVRDSPFPADLDRCRAADGTLADAQPLFAASARGDTVIAYRERSDARARFCELTPATVAVSPASGPVAVGDANITHLSAFGTVAGVVGDDTGPLSVRDPALPGKPADEGQGAVVRDGVFVLPNTVTAAPAELALHLTATAKRDAVTITLPAAGLPAAVRATTDRPQPAADRDSADGRALGRCLARPDGAPVVDAHVWRPANALRLTDTESVHLARYDTMLAICVLRDPADATGTPALTIDDGHRVEGLEPIAVEPNPFLTANLAFYGFHRAPDGVSRSDTVVLAALIGDPRITSVSLSRPDHAPITAPVKDGTALLPGIGLEQNRPADVSGVLTLYDAASNEAGRVTVGR